PGNRLRQRGWCPPYALKACRQKATGGAPRPTPVIEFDSLLPQSHWSDLDPGARPGKWIDQSGSSLLLRRRLLCRRLFGGRLLSRCAPLRRCLGSSLRRCLGSSLCSGLLGRCLRGLFGRSFCTRLCCRFSWSFLTRSSSHESISLLIVRIDSNVASMCNQF